MTEEQILFGLAIAIAVIVGYGWKAYEQKGCSCPGSAS